MTHPKEILEVAVAALDTYGWIQGESGNKDDGFCSMGAIDYATKKLWGGEIFCDPWALAVQSLQQAAKTTSIAGWNDTVGRTYSEVRFVFQEAIRKLENDES